MYSTGSRVGGGGSVDERGHRCVRGPRPTGKPNAKTPRTRAESFFATLKTEFYCRRVWATKARAKKEVGAWIEDRYNRRRLASIGQVTPVSFEMRYSTQTAETQNAA